MTKHIKVIFMCVILRNIYDIFVSINIKIIYSVDNWYNIYSSNNGKTFATKNWNVG